MKILISGKYDKVCKAEVKFATAFFANYLMGEKLAKNLTITLRFEAQGDMAEGHCVPLDPGNKFRTFEIGINPNMKRMKFLQCLAHEMVHVKQYAKGELSTAFSTAMYNGKIYPLSSSFEDYLNWPWEIEAYGRDRSLVLFYRILLKQEKITFKHGRVYMNNKRLTIPKKPAKI